ncbi:MAG: hypothetical protein COB04_02035 [Gammaproteobacteria bacterium]|nr:MAG: hypothetical protein COB04_02035 [Gammaproteobacteria bacterium]
MGQHLMYRMSCKAKSIVLTTNRKTKRCLVFVLVFLMLGVSSAQARETLEQKNEALVSWVEEKISPTREWLEKYVEQAEEWVERQSEKVKSEHAARHFPEPEVSGEGKNNEPPRKILKRVNRDEIDKAIEKVKKNYDGIILSVKRLDLETVKYRIKILLHTGKIKTVSVEGDSAVAVEGSTADGSADVVAASAGEEGLLDVDTRRIR